MELIITINMDKVSNANEIGEILTGLSEYITCFPDTINGDDIPVHDTKGYAVGKMIIK